MAGTSRSTKRTWRLAPSPPPALAWDSYAEVVSDELARRLEDSGDTEPVFQDLLERHPCLLPEPHAVLSLGHHGLLNPGVVSQPELSGFRRKKPDFLMLAYDSEAVTAILVEIEAPAKRWANKKGGPTAELSAAFDQLDDWKSWFKDPDNQNLFMNAYGIESHWQKTRVFEQRYILIYGRREEATRSEAFAKKRKLLAKEHVATMTWDRLKPARHEDRPSIRMDRSKPDATWKTLHFPPTLKLGPAIAARMAELSYREEAIRRNRLMSKERKAFLIGRLAYWDEWAAEHPRPHFTFKTLHDEE